MGAQQHLLVVLNNGSALAGAVATMAHKLKPALTTIFVAQPLTNPQHHVLALHLLTQTTQTLARQPV